MIKELKLNGDDRARGRNGAFIPRRVEVWPSGFGQIILAVESRRTDGSPPIMLYITPAEAQTLAQMLLDTASERKENPNALS